MDDVTTAYHQAEEALAAGDGQGAFTVLRPLLEQADRLDPQQWPTLWVLFARVSSNLAAEELAGLAELARSVAGNGTDATTLCQLGYELIEQRLFGVAATVLERANRLAPGDDDIINELVVALEGVDNHARIRTVIADNPSLLRKHFRYRHALARNTVMDGDLAEARRLAGKLRPGFSAENRSMAGQITDMLARADAVSDVCALDGDDLRGWHFVLTGGLLLHVSPHGFDAMRGRYAYTTDSESRCLEAIHRVSAVLDAFERHPAQVLALPDRNSLALAMAAARHLDRPVATLGERDPDGPGLLVAYDIDGLDDEALGYLAAHRPGQMLWVHASQWTVEQPLTGDLTTYLHQVNVGLWDEGRMRVDPDDNEMVRMPAVEGSPEELAERILGAELEPDALDDLTALVTLARSVRTVNGAGSAAALRFEGWRRPQWTGGPVRSSWFH